MYSAMRKYFKTLVVIILISISSAYQPRAHAVIDWLSPEVVIGTTTCVYVVTATVTVALRYATSHCRDGSRGHAVFSRTTNIVAYAASVVSTSFTSGIQGYLNALIVDSLMEGEEPGLHNFDRYIGAVLLSQYYGRAGFPPLQGGGEFLVEGLIDSPQLLTVSGAFPSNGMSRSVMGFVGVEILVEAASTMAWTTAIGYPWEIPLAGFLHTSTVATARQIYRTILGRSVSYGQRSVTIGSPLIRSSSYHSGAYYHWESNRRSLIQGARARTIGYPRLLLAYQHRWMVQGLFDSAPGLIQAASAALGGSNGIVARLLISSLGGVPRRVYGTVMGMYMDNPETHGSIFYWNQDTYFYSSRASGVSSALRAVANGFGALIGANMLPNRLLGRPFIWSPLPALSYRAPGELHRYLWQETDQASANLIYSYVFGDDYEWILEMDIITD